MTAFFFLGVVDEAKLNLQFFAEGSRRFPECIHHFATMRAKRIVWVVNASLLAA